MYTETTEISYRDADLTNRIKVSALVALMQEVAGKDSAQYGWGWEALLAEDVCFVITRLNIKMFKYPQATEKIRISSFPEGHPRLIFERGYRVETEDGELVAEANSEWVLLNFKKRSIERPTAVSLPPFPDSAMQPEVFKLEKERYIFEPEDSVKKIPLYSDYDHNRHVNNAKYIEWIEDMMPAERYDFEAIEELDIKFEQEISVGEPVEISWAEKDGYKFYQGKDKDGKSHFKAKVKYRRV